MITDIETNKDDKIYEILNYNMKQLNIIDNEHNIKNIQNNLLDTREQYDENLQNNIFDTEEQYDGNIQNNLFDTGEQYDENIQNNLFYTEEQYNENIQDSLFSIEEHYESGIIKILLNKQYRHLVKSIQSEKTNILMDIIKYINISNHIRKIYLYNINMLFDVITDINVQITNNNIEEIYKVDHFFW